MQDKSSFLNVLLSPTNERHLHPAAVSASVAEPAYTGANSADAYCFSSGARGSHAASDSASSTFGNGHNTTVFRSDAVTGSFSDSTQGTSRTRRAVQPGASISYTTNQRHEVNPGARTGISHHSSPLPPHWRPDPAMDRWQDDLIGAVSEPSEQEVFGYIQSASRALGFDHVS